MITLPEPPYSGAVVMGSWHPTLDLTRIYGSETWAIADSEERAWLLRIWAEPWRSDPVGTMPCDLECFAGRVGCSVSFLEAHREVLLRGWFACNDGLLYHRVIAEMVLGRLSRRRADAVRARRYRHTKTVTRDADTVTRDAANPSKISSSLENGPKNVTRDAAKPSRVTLNGGHNGSNLPKISSSLRLAAVGSLAREDVICEIQNSKENTRPVALESYPVNPAVLLLHTASSSDRNTPGVAVDNSAAAQQISSGLSQLDLLGDPAATVQQRSALEEYLGSLVASVFSYWREIMNHPKARLSTVRERSIRKRLVEDGFSVDDLKRAIDGCKSSPYHQGRNSSHTIYDDIELICRDAGRVEGFIARVNRKNAEADRLAAWLAEDNGLVIDGEVIEHG